MEPISQKADDTAGNAIGEVKEEEGRGAVPRAVLKDMFSAEWRNSGRDKLADSRADGFARSCCSSPSSGIFEYFSALFKGTHIAVFVTVDDCKNYQTNLEALEKCRAW